MSFDYSTYCGPAIIVEDGTTGPSCLPTDEIDERLYDARAELRHVDNGKRYILPNRGGYGRNLTPREDNEQAPEILGAAGVAEEVAKFIRDFEDDIDWVKNTFPGSKVSVRWIILMDAR